MFPIPMNPRNLHHLFSRLLPSFLRFTPGLIAFGLSGLAGYAQPSGGPYGPVQQTYELPQAKRIFFVAPDGKADAPGTALAQPTALETAIAAVRTGDAIVLRGGVYRTG